MHETRTVSVQAKAYCEVASLHPKDITDILDRYPFLQVVARSCTAAGFLFVRGAESHAGAHASCLVSVLSEQLRPASSSCSRSHGRNTPAAS